MNDPDAARRLLIVDDHAIVREGLVRILENAPRRPPAGAVPGGAPGSPPQKDAPEDGGHPWQVAEAASGFQALEWLRRNEARLAIVDLSMPGMSGLDLVARLHAEFPRLRVLVLSMHAEEQYALRAFQAGAHGYLTKDRASHELMDAVTKVANGGVYVTNSLAEQVVQRLNGARAAPRHAELSNRELEVLRRIVAGQRLSEIADALHLSIKTISTHKRRIQDKLELPTMAALIRYGMEHGLQEGDAPGARLGEATPQPPGE